MELQHPDTQPIYYVGLNKKMELVHITEQEKHTNNQGGRTYCTQLDQGEEISLPSLPHSLCGGQESSPKHLGTESDGGHFLHTVNSHT